MVVLWLFIGVSACFFGMMLQSILTLVKGGVYPSRQALKRRIQLFAMCGTIFFLLVLIVWRFLL